MLNHNQNAAVFDFELTDAKFSVDQLEGVAGTPDYTVEF